MTVGKTEIESDKGTLKPESFLRASAYLFAYLSWGHRFTD